MKFIEMSYMFIDCFVKKSKEDKNGFLMDILNNNVLWHPKAELYLLLENKSILKSGKGKKDVF